MREFNLLIPILLLVGIFFVIDGARLLFSRNYYTRRRAFLFKAGLGKKEGDEQSHYYLNRYGVGLSAFFAGIFSVIASAILLTATI